MLVVRKALAFMAIDIVAVLTALFTYQLQFIEFDYNFERFFPVNDPDTELYLEHRKRFSTDNDFVIVGVGNKQGIFQKDFLLRVDSLTKALSVLRNVTEVTSPTTIKHPVRDPIFGQVFDQQWLRYKNPEHYQRDSAAIYQSPQLIGSYFSKDAKAVSVFIQTKEFLGRADCDSLGLDLKRLLPNFQFDEIHVAGRSIVQSYFVQLMRDELSLFLGTSALLVIIFLIIAFRSVWGVWVPLLVVLLSVIWILGFMTLTGKAVDVMSNILPTILFVVGMSDVIHILTKYLEELRNGLPKAQAIKIAVREVGLATFLTSLTTSVGFLTLMAGGVLPIKAFGLYTAIGVFMAYILAYSILPAIIVLGKEPKIASLSAGFFWRRNLHRVFLWIIKKRKAIFVGSIVVMLLSTIGVMNIKINNYLLEDISLKDPIRVDFNYFEENFAGVRPFEMLITLPPNSKSVLDIDVLRALDSLEKYLVKDYGVGFMISPLSIAKTLHQSNQGGKPSQYKLPESDAKLQVIAKEMKRFGKHPRLKSVLSKDLTRIRIVGKMGDIGGIEIKRRNAALHEFISTSLPPEFMQYKFTGTASLIDKNSDYLVENMIQGLLIAFGVIVLIVGLLFRSIRMVFIALIPNILPLVMIAGVMGVFGVDLHVSTSIIFTIAFGIAVDDSIHFLMKFRVELNKGRTVLYAVKRSYISTGKAIIVTTLILCGGFLTLIFSNFMGTFYIGLLISLTMVFAVLGDLLLLPVILIFWYPRVSSKTPSPAVRP